MKDFVPVVTKTVTTKTSYKITAEDIEEMLIEKLGLDSMSTTFDWDVSMGDLVKGVFVIETKKD